MNLVPTRTLERFLLCWLLLVFVLLFYFIGCFSFPGFRHYPSHFRKPSPGLPIGTLTHFSLSAQHIANFHFLSLPIVLFLFLLLLYRECYRFERALSRPQTFLKLQFFNFSTLLHFFWICIYQGFPRSEKFCFENWREFMIRPKTKSPLNYLFGSPRNLSKSY